MLNKIIYFSVKNKLIIGLLTCLLIVWGTWSASRLPLDAVPDITNNQVQVITVAPSLAAQETEQLVTYPIEQGMANLPDLEEMRSISRFGLSVITLVFKDEVDIYFARQLINEKLQDVADQIPGGVGRPELGPVSTGLGEVYQYVIHPKKGSEQKYSAMDLRSMQDWIVARQLYGTPGVAEVNSFGGLVKQYEVAINPYRLQAMNISIAEVFSALEKNNGNTGGAYIDKKPNAYFIRGVGLIGSMDDIRNTVIRKVNNIPVLIRDVAEVRIGHATRYGAVSYNGEKEVVGGIVMMLKGANSAAVVNRVKEKIASIQKALPHDVVIEPFLDRTELVSRALNTVKKNLLEGALIVLFVLVLFLGNIRAGLIVASAIPLALLFALGMMQLFGVSANLMSLGAIDFGLIVDGAVIIVEATLLHLSRKKYPGSLSAEQMDEEVYQAASQTRKSAAFGEIIILLVYIPILTLQGIEGKMFRPMGQTVGFALVGALILSMTYIPMMSALCLSKKQLKEHKVSEQLMQFFHRYYDPLIRWALRMKYSVAGVSAALLLAAVFMFSRMGGEFIPQLQEGDFAFHCILPQGSSLSQSIETSMQASRIIRSFQEVKMVVGKTGSAEVPTDPMPPEASDLVVVLKPQQEWNSSRSYKELGDAISKKLAAIPGVFFEYSQPIQMRFNELMTGVRQDVAIKIFGENIDTLAALAPRIARIVQSVSGTSEAQVERTTGLPQITVRYDRARIAGYGLNIEDINHTINTAFAGGHAGVIFEDERRFDLVVRLDTGSRGSIEDVSNLYITGPGGSQVPLSQVAQVSYMQGPAQISRESGKRRIVVGFNVKDRDVQHVVEDIRTKLNKADLLPVGYYYTYGGTFENLQKASARLAIAVPLALALILVLLYLTFRSLKEALLIFTAIPMSAIGGVFALLLRGMPFSISAGVGFIALFGVSVLNGIVLISTFNQLEKDGIADLTQRVIEGTKLRLRPVLMTAMVASLGFLPMALSTGAGAEVQKPLATVVIGGLVSATFLTLVLLPVLYLLFAQKVLKPKVVVTALLLPLLLLGSAKASAQAGGSRSVSMDEVLSMAKGNLQYEVQTLRLRQGKAQVGSASLFNKTGFFAENEDLRPTDHKGILKVGVAQSISWFGLYRAQKKLYRAQYNLAGAQTMVIDATLKKELRSAYYELWFLHNKRQLFSRLDSLYKVLSSAAKLKVEAGESPGLDSIAAEVRVKEIGMQGRNLDMDIRMQQLKLMQLLNSADTLVPLTQPLVALQVPDAPADSLHPALAVQAQQLAVTDASVSVIRNENRPEFSGRFFSQRLWGADNPFTGFSVMASFPLFNAGTTRSKTRAAIAGYAAEEKQYEYEQQLWQYKKLSQWQETEQHKAMLQFYESSGLQQTNEMIKASTLAYRSGEIGFPELMQYLGQAIDIQRNYLDALNTYNQSLIQYYYYTNQ